MTVRPHRFADRVRSRTELPPARAVSEAASLRVSAVHPNSIAEAAGLRAGLYYHPSAMPASVLQLAERRMTGEVVSHFTDVEAGRDIDIVSVGFPFGMELAKSPAALAADTLGDRLDVDGLAALVHSGDMSDIGRYVGLVAGRQRGRNQSVFEIIRSKFASGNGGDAALDPAGYWGLPPQVGLVGAFWLALHGGRDEARRLLVGWERWGVAASGPSFAALYHATQALLDDAGDPGRENLATALALAPSSTMIRQLSAARSGADVVPASAPRQTRLLSYRLPQFDPLLSEPVGIRRYVSSDDVLSGLGADRRLLVIALGAYRANGFYDRIMRRLVEVDAVLGRYYPAVHVITGYAPGGRHRNEWLGGEHLARQAGLKIDILFDDGNALAGRLAGGRSPAVLIAAGDGTLTYDGTLPDEGGLWSGLG